MALVISLSWSRRLSSWSALTPFTLWGGGPIRTHHHITLGLMQRLPFVIASSNSFPPQIQKTVANCLTLKWFWATGSTGWRCIKDCFHPVVSPRRPPANTSLLSYIKNLSMLALWADPSDVGSKRIKTNYYAYSYQCYFDHYYCCIIDKQPNNNTWYIVFCTLFRIIFIVSCYINTCNIILLVGLICCVMMCVCTCTFILNK